MPTSSTDSSVADYRPRLCRDLATVVCGESFVVEGGPLRHVFRGRAATEVLPRLLPLLDGSRDAADIAEHLSLTRGQVGQVLGLLEQRGLVESATPVAPAALAQSPTGSQVLDWFSRNLPDSGGYACAEGVSAVLADTTVVVAGAPGDAVRALARDLVDTGLGEVLVFGAGEPPPVAVESAGRRCVAVVFGSADVPGWMVDAGVPVLRVGITSEHVEIGPVFFPDFTACPECLRRSRDDAGLSDSGTTAASPLADLAAGLAAAEVVALAARLPSGADPRTLTRLSVADWSTEAFWVVPYEDCDACVTLPAAGPDRLPDLFEWSVQDRPIPLAPGREIPPWELRRIQELKKQRPALPTLPRRDLPPTVLPAPGKFGRTHPADGPPRVSEELWATLLRQTAGVHEAQSGVPARRWTPCGGGLASVELYLIDEHGFPGLPGTTFRYDDLDHRLMTVRADRIRLADLLAGTGLDADGAQAAVVLVAAHARLAAKYRQFAYRLAHLDAGCASTQLTTLARAHGLDVRFATRWDARVADTLGLARDDQFVTAVATLGRRPVANPEETACR